MKLFVDVVFTIVEDANPDERRIIRDNLRFFNQALTSSKAFKQGLIDGYETLYFEGEEDSFYTGLLDYVLFHLKPWGIEIEIEYSEDYKTPPVEAVVEDSFNGKTLRDYQKDAIQKALLQKRGVLQIPTGGGKTTCAVYLTKLIGEQTLFTVNTSVLAVQTALAYKNAGFESVGILCGLTKRTADSLRKAGVVLFQDVSPEEFWGLQVIIPVIHSLRNAIAQSYGAYEYLQTQVKLYIADEAHGVPAKIWQTLTAACNAHYRIALSATPYDDSLHPVDNSYRDRVLQGLFGSRLCYIPINYLHETNVLPRPELYVIPVPYEPGDENDWPSVYRTGIRDHQWRNAQIASVALLALANKKKVFISVLQKAHGKTLLEMIGKWTTSPVFFAHGDETTWRYTRSTEEITKLDIPMDLFHLKLSEIDSTCLIGCTNYDQGVDLPNLDLVIYAGGRKKLNRVLQRVGRGIRPKDKIVVVDFFDQGYQSLLRHSRRRMEIYSQVGWPVFEGAPSKSVFR